MEVETKLNIKINLNKRKKFMALILNTKHTKNSFDGKILGLTLCDWVKFACNNLPCNVVDFDKSENPLEFAKKHIDFDYDYTLILFSSTPLLQQSTVCNIIEYAEYKNCNLIKLSVGYVVKNELLKNNSLPQIDSLYNQNMEDFYIVENKSQFTYAFKILSERINNFHIENGVDIVNPNNTYIEPFVDIEKGAKIFPNNSLKGKTKISQNAILKENNVITNSKIGKNSIISSSEIEDSVIGENVCVASFSNVKNCLIGNGAIIKRCCSLVGYNVKTDQVIEENSNLGENNDSDNRAR